MSKNRLWNTVLFLTGFVCSAAPTLAADRPNFVLIMTDDQGWGDLGVHGNPVLTTPNLDRLCEESCEFTRFYVSPVCSLTRASLLTGRHPLRTGCYDTRFGHDTLAASEITIADVLKTAGYKTALFGKWHQGRYMPSHPNRRGFDEFFGFWQYGHVERYLYPDRMWHNAERVECRGHVTELITDAAIDFVRSANDPFFCYVAYNVPHAPWIAPPELVEKYVKLGVTLRDAQIYALVEQCDAQIGRLLKAIDDRGVRDNTVVMFLSDNGGISRHYTAGLHGSKGTVYEGGIRSPFFARYPGRFPAGSKVSSMGDVVDLLPTVAELAGADVPQDRKIDGVSLVDRMNGTNHDAPHEYLCHTWSRDVPRDDVNWAIQNATYKLANGKLFEIAKDDSESQDIAAERPEVAAKMRQAYVDWFNDVTAGQTYGRVSIEVGRDDENPVDLQPSWGELHGKDTRYTFDAYDWDVIDGWRKSGDAVDWQVEVVRPGRYEVTVAYGCQRADAGGVFAVRAGDSELRATVEATPTPNVFVTRTIGFLELEPGAAKIRIEAEKIPGQQLMALNRVSLRRIDD